MLTHISFGDQTATKDIAILVAARDLTSDGLQQHYVAPLELMGINPDRIVAFSLQHNAGNKIGVVAARAHLDMLKPVLDSMGITNLLCCDGTYFKALTKKTKVEQSLGYRCDTQWPEQDVFYCPGFRQMFYNPDIGKKITLALQGLQAHLDCEPCIFDENIIQHAYYPKTLREKKAALLRLLEFPELTCDIETYSLQVSKAGLGSIAFGETLHSGTAFLIDHSTEESEQPILRKLLRQFFVAYAERGGRLVWHGGSYDAKILIWEVFMSAPEDITGMLEGLDILYSNFDCTKTMAYLATNTTAGNSLSLKDLAYEFTGNYALEDIKDISKVEPAKLLEYNLIDALATRYVQDKYLPTEATERTIYNDLFIPSLKVITCMELVGLPLNIGKVLLARKELEDVCCKALDDIRNCQIVQDFVWVLRDDMATAATAQLKKLVKTRDDYLDFEFNPGSDVQLRKLLFEELGLKSLNKTKGGNPSTDAKTLKALVEHVKLAKQPRPDILALLGSIQELAAASTILTTFMPAFIDKSTYKDSWKYLQGSFNLGGTKSGRLSSSKPNLQNIPSTGTKYAKLVKRCFQAPPRKAGDPNGWLFVGADFFSLEDRVSALLTKDPNKLGVYIDGYDGHCLRAYSYFSDTMPDITLALSRAQTAAERVEIINSIKDIYPDQRQNS
ncbi:hypothetical protein DRO66_06975, partial [Candidatus Bathyarchaeota archaeon]